MEISQGNIHFWFLLYRCGSRWTLPKAPSERSFLLQIHKIYPRGLEWAEQKQVKPREANVRSTNWLRGFSFISALRRSIAGSSLSRRFSKPSCVPTCQIALNNVRLHTAIDGAGGRITFNGEGTFSFFSSCSCFLMKYPPDGLKVQGNSSHSSILLGLPTCLLPPVFSPPLSMSRLKTPQGTLPGVLFIASDT